MKSVAWGSSCRVCATGLRGKAVARGRAQASVRLIPVGSGPDLDPKRDAQLGGTCHSLANCGHDLFDGVIANLEHELIVHLHDQARRRLLALAPSVYGDHGALDDIGGRALHRCVDRCALRGLLQLAVARADIGQVEPAAIYGLDEATVPGSRAGVVHEALHSRITGEVALDILLSCAAFDAELTRQTERGHTVDQAEVDRLREAPLIGADGFES